MADVAKAKGLVSALASGANALRGKRFQQAAGYFEHVKGSVFPPETHASASGTPVTPDLSEQGLTMATQLMLAQAQACYYEMAVRKRNSSGGGGGAMSPSLLARLAVQAAEYYGLALDASRSPALGTHLDTSWPLQLEFKHLCFQACAL